MRNLGYRHDLIISQVTFCVKPKHKSCVKKTHFSETFRRKNFQKKNIFVSCSSQPNILPRCASVLYVLCETLYSNNTRLAMLNGSNRLRCWNGIVRDISQTFRRQLIPTASLHLSSEEHPWKNRYTHECTHFNMY